MAKDVNVMTGVDAQGNPQFQSIGLSGRDNRAQATTQTATNMANLALAKYQNDWNYEFWTKQNEYNSPSHQLALMKAAGLNPNLYAPEGMTAASVSSANMANAAAPTLNTSRGSQLAQNVMAALAEGKNIFDSYLGKKQYELAKKRTDKEIERLDAQNDETKANTELLKKKANLTEVDIDRGKKEIEQVNANIAKLAAEKDKIFSEVSLSSKQLEYFDSDKSIEQALKKSMTNLNFKNLQVSDSTIKQLEAQAVKLAKEAIKEGYEIDIADINYSLKKIDLSAYPEQKQAEIMRAYFGSIPSFLASAVGLSLQDIQKAFTGSDYRDQLRNAAMSSHSNPQ